MVAKPPLPPDGPPSDAPDGLTGEATLEIPRAQFVSASEERFWVIRVDAGSDMLSYALLDEQEETVVGRDERADLVLRDDSVSRRHAAFLALEGERCRVRDLGSTNGTSVDGEPVVLRMLRSGESVSVGSVSLRFEVLGLAEYRHLRQVNRKLRMATDRDPLTNLYLRSVMQERVPALLSGCLRRGVAFSVAFVDLDHFKQVNDRFGHRVGDAVLEQVARIGLHRCRETDLLLRYGGEELLLVMPDTDLTGAAATAERVMRAIRAHSWSQVAPELAVTASFGVAELMPGESLDSLIERADQAMYRAKQAGRDRLMVAGQ
jgi:diguanylate cyclase (GGDEF)-like protein